MIKLIIYFLLAFLSLNAYADGAAYGGRHEIAVDGLFGSFRHVHDWSSPKLREIYWDTSNPDRIFTSDNDFSYVEFIDRYGEVRLRKPSPAFTYLAVYMDSYFVGLSRVKLFNRYQLVIWNGKGEVIHKQNVSSHVHKFDNQLLQTFKQKYPQAYQQIKSCNFIYNSVTYNYCAGHANLKNESAWEFIKKNSTLVKHPYIYSSETVSNFVDWVKFPLDFREDTLVVPTKRGAPFTIDLGEAHRIWPKPPSSSKKLRK